MNGGTATMSSIGFRLLATALSVRLAMVAASASMSAVSSTGRLHSRSPWPVRKRPTSHAAEARWMRQGGFAGGRGLLILLFFQHDQEVGFQQPSERDAFGRAVRGDQGLKLLFAEDLLDVLALQEHDALLLAEARVRPAARAFRPRLSWSRARPRGLRPPSPRPRLG